MNVYAGQKAEYILHGRYKIRGTNFKFDYTFYGGVPNCREDALNFAASKGAEIESDKALTDEAIRKWITHETEDPGWKSFEKLCEFANESLELPRPLEPRMFLDEFRFDRFMSHVGAADEVSPYNGYADKYALREYFRSFENAQADYRRYGECIDLYRWKENDPEQRVTRAALVILPPARVSLRRGEERWFVPVRMAVPSEVRGPHHMYAGLMTTGYNNMTTIYLRQEDGATRDVCFILASSPEYGTVKGHSLRRGHLTTSKIEGSTKSAYSVPYEIALIGNCPRATYDDEAKFLEDRPMRGLKRGDDPNWPHLVRFRGGKG